MDYTYNGERFLDVLYSQLYKSEEVLHTKEKSDTKEESIKRYMDRLESIHNKANTKNKKDLVKHLYFDKYVIKEEDLPRYLDDNTKNGIIESQKKTLGTWIDYLTDESAMYPMWAKYWVFGQMIKMGTYDEISGKYTKRTKNTINPFVEANPEVIAKCIGNLTALLGTEKLSAQQIKKIVSNISFEKMYIEYQKNIKEQYKSNEGIWIKYNEGIVEDAKKLSASLEGYNTGWCTAGESTAIDQLCGKRGYLGGDFYVYYTKDEDNEYKVPRIAIRLDGHSSIGEIRGVEEHQNLEEEMVPILESKLNEMTFLDKSDVSKNIEIVNKLKYLISIKDKTLNNIQLTEQEIIDLYLEKFGFGWQQDPLPRKIIEKRNIPIDYKLIKNLDLKVKKAFLFKAMPLLNISKENRFIDEIEVIKLIALQNMRVLAFATEDILKDKSFLLEMVKISGVAINYMLDEFKYDKDIIQEAAKTYASAIKYASEDLLNNKNYILEIVKNNGLVLEYVGESLKKDRDVCLTASNSRHPVMQYASEELKTDREFVLKIVKINALNILYVDKKFMQDREIILEAVKNDGQIYSNISKELRQDKEIAKEAVKSDVSEIFDVPDEIRKDKEFILYVLENTNLSLSEIFFSEPMLIDDEDIILATIKKRNTEIILAAPRLKENRDFIFKAVSVNPYILEFLSEYSDDKEIINEAVKKNGAALQYASYNLRNNKEFVLEMVKINDYAYLFRGNNLEYDREITLEAIKSSKGVILSEIKDITKFENYKELFELGLELFENEIMNYIDDDEIIEDLNYFEDNVKQALKEDTACIEKLTNVCEKIRNIDYERKGLNH